MPGINAWFGTEFNRNNTWFSQLDLFTSYLKRCNFMLQQGLNVADVAYFIGEDAPKMTGIRDPEIPQGYSFDYINAEVIVRDLRVKDGKLVLPHGTSYRILALPPQKTMRPEVLRKIEQLVAAGAVIVGNPPQRSPSGQNYPKADQEIQTVAGRMWGDPSLAKRSYGKGRIYTHTSLKQVFEELNLLPDCNFNGENEALYVHRKLEGGKDIYFISNQKDSLIRIHPAFRVSGKQPEEWNPVTGKIRRLPAFEQGEKTTTVPLQLEAGESAFIVFRQKGKPKAEGWEANYPAAKTIIELSGPWEIDFESDAVKRGPSDPIIFSQLQDWKQHPDERIRYFSGTAVYKTSFMFPEKTKNEQLFLDLGAVNVMAKVYLNGKYAGGAWTPPYRLPITPFLKTGSNRIEIEVVNTWVNRLIGDLQLPEKDRPTWVPVNPFHPDSPLQSSGLMGPVKVIAEPFEH
jgi:hypothetical protein